VLWPDHCIQVTPGADFHKALHIPHAALVIRKGSHRAIDSYSAFYQNDRKTPTGLLGYLRKRALKRVFFAGLALDFCVRYSAEDARRGIGGVRHRGRLPRHRSRRFAPEIQVGIAILAISPEYQQSDESLGRFAAHSRSWSSAGHIFCPHFVNAYSTLGGTCG
jgi:nicotinamidase-related amidase